jgi:hypothetical protein
MRDVGGRGPVVWHAMALYPEFAFAASATLGYEQSDKATMKYTTHFLIWLLICSAPWLTEASKIKLGPKFMSLIVLMAGPANYYWLGHQSIFAYAIALIPFFSCISHLRSQKISDQRFFCLAVASWLIVSFPIAILLIPIGLED